MEPGRALAKDGKRYRFSKKQIQSEMTDSSGMNHAGNRSNGNRPTALAGKDRRQTQTGIYSVSWIRYLMVRRFIFPQLSEQLIEDSIEKPRLFRLQIHTGGKTLGHGERFFA